MKTEVILCDICHYEIKGHYVQVKRKKNNIHLDICPSCRYVLIILDKLKIKRNSYNLDGNIEITEVED
jgi:Zn-finger nucleic acid-binding protein